LLVCVKGTAHS
jgi:hypothetical protein